MRRFFILAVGLGLFPGPAHASDIAEALSFAQEVMGDEIYQGLEDFDDYDPDESLSMLLSRQASESTEPKEAPFSTMGATRLTFAQLRGHIEAASAQTGLPIALIDAVIRTESGYRPQAVSRTGAQGLMQLMPPTAREVGVQDAFDPRENIMGGSRYLRKLYDSFGSLRLAIAAYNAGPGAVRKHGGVPPFKETRLYVETVLRRYQDSTHK